MFTPSSPNFRVSFETPEAKSGWCALALDGFSHLRTSARLNGLEVSAMLDSGAARTVIDEAFARQLGMKPQSGFGMVGVTGAIDGATVTIPKLTVGALQISNVAAAVTDLSSLNDPHNPPLRLILGREFFEAVLADIDLPHGRIQFERSATHRTVVARADLLPLHETAGGSRAFPITINGSANAQAIFDLGYNAPLLISPDFAAQNGLLDNRPISTVASMGIEGMVVSQVATVDKVTLGTNIITNVPIEVPPTWARSTPVFVGLPLLARFSILTDYGHNQISFLPDPALEKTPIGKDHSGIGAQRVTEGLRVVHVSRNSPASAAGLAIGDTIVTINGHVVDGAYLSSHPRMGTMPVGTQFELGLASGKTLHMTLADYY